MAISDQSSLAVPADGHAGVLGLLALHALVLKLYRCRLHYKDGLWPRWYLSCLCVFVDSE